MVITEAAAVASFLAMVHVLGLPRATTRAFAPVILPRQARLADKPQGDILRDVSRIQRPPSTTFAFFQFHARRV